MKLPEKQRAGVEGLAKAPSGAAMGAAQAEMGAIKSKYGAVSRAGEFTTDMAELYINRAVDRNTVEFALAKNETERELKDTPYMNAEDLPEKYSPAGGRVTRVPDGKGGFTEQPRQIPTWEYAPELKRDKLTELAQAKAKDIPSSVARDKYLKITMAAIDDQYTKDYTTRIDTARRKTREETVTDVNLLKQREETDAALFLVKNSTVFDDNEKRQLTDGILHDAEQTTIYNSIAESNTDLMVEQLENLKKADEYVGNFEDKERLKYIGMLERALEVKDNVNKQALLGELRDYMAMRTDGNTEKDPQMMNAAKALGIESEMQAAEQYGDVAFGLDTAGFEDYGNRLAEAKAGALNIKDYRLRQQYLDKIDAQAEKRESMLAEDPAGYAALHSNKVKSSWNTFNRTMMAGNPADARIAWGMYKQESIAEQMRLGVTPDNVTLIPADSGFSQGITQAIEEAPVGQKADTVRRITAALGADAVDVALELAPDNMAFASSVMTMEYDQRAAENILSGVNVPNTVSNADFTDGFNDYYGAVSITDGMGGIQEAAKMYYLGVADPKQLQDFDSGLYQQAIDATVGPPMIGFNNSGSPTATFRDARGKFVDSDRFKQVVNSINDATLSQNGQGDMFIGGNVVNPRDVLKDAIFIPAGHGLYQLELLGSAQIEDVQGNDRAGIGYVQNADGSPYVLDMRKANSKYVARAYNAVESLADREDQAKATRAEATARQKALEEAERQRILNR